ncbi:hypothetical protein MTO96_027424 [Rhipicephalus appendiculatus]
MDLEKLVALGEKMGLSGAELRKWVSQKEKEEREMKERQLKAELEKERLAAERAKEEREAQERQMQAEMAEREKQRQHEIELERLRLQQRIEAPDQLPEAKLEVETRYFSGRVTALYMTTPLFDLIIGNIDGARGPNDPECLGEDPKIEHSSTQEPRREGTVDENPVKEVTRAQAEAEVLEKVKLETPTVTVPDEKTCRAGDVATKQPPTTMSQKRTKSVAQTQQRVVHELVKHQQGTNERDDEPPVSNMSKSAETPFTTPFSETARNKKKRKIKKRSSEHRKKWRKRDVGHAG